MSKEQLRLAGAEEFVIKQRCEDILHARSDALETLAESPIIKQRSQREGGGQDEIPEIRYSEASATWRFAYEARNILSSTEVGKEAWEEQELGEWRLPHPGTKVNGSVEEILNYSVDADVAADGMPPRFVLRGVKDFVALAPPVTARILLRRVPEGQHNPSAQRQQETFEASPPRRLSIAVFEAVDEVLAEVGLQPEVDAADEEAEIEYQDLL